MRYAVYLKNKVTIMVDEDTGMKVMKAKEQGRDDATFRADGSMYEVGEVKSVVLEKLDVQKYQREMSEKMTEWETNLGVLAKQSVKQKTQREMNQRIKVALPDVVNHELVKDMLKAVAQFFTDNPNYPWCPVAVWKPFFFQRGDAVPPVMQLMVRHDIAVANWASDAKHDEDSLLEIFDGKVGDMYDEE